ncbi:EpsG family protein [Buttiauxella agrestis]|uniref:Capsular polysaccharide biosynthesis protein n=1 Tax=Buttiauxella agrestis ATCC 33320 TaxID=1006004 RepID=A0A085GB59_9ENTR|nr:EpsG family protein [Buttiauxella agrestis]KFC80954.1 capsular polysaccharide biosynthesis protein [Buttiauxella agrestis ATCC 33320]
MYIYVGVFVLLVLFSFPREQRIFYNPMLFILFIICGFRGANVDRDYQNYQFLMHLSASDIFYPIEPTFKVISWMAVNIFQYDNLLFILYSAIIIFFKSKFIKRTSPYILLSLVVYFSNTYLLHDMTQIRVGAASAIAFYALKYIVEKNRQKFFLFLLIAFAFHYTAILFIIALFFDTRRIHFSYILAYSLMVIVVYVAYFFGINVLTLLSYVNVPYVQAKYSDYVAQNASVDFVPINVYSALQFIHLTIVYYSFFAFRKIQGPSEIILITKLYTLAPLALVLFSFIPVFSLRISELFSVAEIVLLPALVALTRQKMISKLFVIAVAICMFYINIFHVGILNDYSF